MPKSNNIRNLKSNKPFHNTWREYYDKGWAPLYLPPDAKSPPPGGYTGASGLLAGIETLERWASGTGEPTRDGYPTEVKPKANIALRLGAPIEIPDAPTDYGNHTNIKKWRVVGIDVDNYVKDGTPKQGGQQLLDLIDQLGALPPTVILTSRYAQFTAGELGEGITAPHVIPGIRLYLVPDGVVAQGRIAADIETVQWHHRYAVTWPSIVDGRVYQWISPDDFIAGGGDAAATESNALTVLPGPIDAHSLPLLPERWLTSDDFLANNTGWTASDGEVSQLKESELLEWAWAHLPLPINEGEYGDIDGVATALGELGDSAPMCKRQLAVVQKFLRAIEEYEPSHDPLTQAHWEIFRLAGEGHRGWYEAMTVVNAAWIDDVGGKGKRSLDVAEGEVARSVYGALRKLEPIFDPARCHEKCWSREHQHREWMRLGGDRIKENRDALLDNNIDEYGEVIGRMRLREELESVDGHLKCLAYPRTDYGNAQHLIDLYGDDLKYVLEYKQWIIWSNGRWWRDTRDAHLMGIAFKRVIARIAAGAEELRGDFEQAIASGITDTNILKGLREKWKAAAAWATTSAMRTRARAAVQLAELTVWHEIPALINQDLIDGNPLLLGCANGVVHLERNAPGGAWIEPARKQDYVTRNTAVEWIRWVELMRLPSDEQAEYGVPEWLAYLDKFIPDPEQQRFVQKVLGHGLIGGNPERLMLFLYGPTSTGKSTLLDCVNAALGDYAATDNIRLFQFHKLNPALAEALPMRIVSISEVDDAALSPAMIKSITGGDTVVCELKNSNEQIRRKPQFMPIIATNAPPEIAGADEALQRRVLTIPFDQQVSLDDENPIAGARVASVAKVAVLSWLVEGWNLYAREGIERGEALPESLQAAQRELTGGFNPTMQFVRECCELLNPTAVRHEARANRKSDDQDDGELTGADWYSVDDGAWVIPTADFKLAFEKWLRAETGQARATRTTTMLSRELGSLGVKALVMKLGGKATKVYAGIKIVNAPDGAIKISMRPAGESGDTGGTDPK